MMIGLAQLMQHLGKSVAYAEFNAHTTDQRGFFSERYDFSCIDQLDDSCYQTDPYFSVDSPHKEWSGNKVISTSNQSPARLRQKGLTSEETESNYKRNPKIYISDTLGRNHVVKLYPDLDPSSTKIKRKARYKAETFAIELSGKRWRETDNWAKLRKGIANAD